MNRILGISFAHLALILCLSIGAIQAQTTAFNFQGQLTDGGAPANGPYDLQFKLFDAASGGNQIGATLPRDDVNVAGGVFNVSLDFGAAAFPGAARWLEISVRQGASTGAYTTLTPRQQVNSTPYAIRALSADTVTGPVPASQITGTLPPGALGGSYIENTTTQQTASNFNISGDGTAGGTLSGNVVNAATQYNIGGNRVLAVGGGNVFVGLVTGQSNTGLRNTFVGTGAGYTNTSGEDNAFSGVYAGGTNVTGSHNSFFGAFAGYSNKSSDNAIFGYRAGYSSTGSSNAFFGSLAGRNNSEGSSNAFFGANAGRLNSTGSVNTFIGENAGEQNTTGKYNTFVGNAAGGNVSGNYNTFIGTFAGSTQPDTSYSIAIGAEASVDRSNTIVLGSDKTYNVVVNGNLYFSRYISGGSTNIPMCYALLDTINANPPGSLRVGGCSSSRRYKTNIASLPAGLNLVNRLRPVTFDWKEGGARDLGFIAEEVAEIEPLLTFRNDKGQIEGVKYQLLSAVLVGAVKEQQAQIEQQQALLKAQQEQFKQQQEEIAQLKQLVCAAQPQAAVCQPKP